MFSFHIVAIADVAEKAPFSPECSPMHTSALDKCGEKNNVGVDGDGGQAMPQGLRRSVDFCSINALDLSRKSTAESSDP